MQPVVSIKGLTKTYKSGLQALKATDLTIGKGEIFALLGPNGAGKTTLISIVCGIVTPTTGTVTADGHDIRKDYRAARSKIGLVPQELTTDAFETVLATVTFSRGLFGKAPDPGHIEKTLRDLSLWDKRNDRIMTLSGGMKRRVMIAKALSHEPDILFLDEPTAGVDVELRRQLWSYVKGLNDLGVTIVLTTHYLEEAQELCDTIAIVNRGKVVACEPTAILLQRLDTRAVVITPREPLSAVPDLGGFDARLRPDGRLAVTFKTATAGVEEVLNRVREAGVAIKDLATEDPDLEDVFLALTYADPTAADPTKD